MWAMQELSPFPAYVFRGLLCPRAGLSGTFATLPLVPARQENGALPPLLPLCKQTIGSTYFGVQGDPQFQVWVADSGAGGQEARESKQASRKTMRPPG
jgi:hypothetical protein